MRTFHVYIKIGICPIILPISFKKEDVTYTELKSDALSKLQELFEHMGINCDDQEKYPASLSLCEGADFYTCGDRYINRAQADEKIPPTNRDFVALHFSRKALNENPELDSAAPSPARPSVSTRNDSIAALVAHTSSVGIGGTRGNVDITPPENKPPVASPS